MYPNDWDRLLQVARGGDVEALGNLLELASVDLRAAATGVLGRATQMRLSSEDIFADALIAVLREIGSLRATSYVGFRYWFASIARNQVRRALRNERDRPGTRVEEAPETTDQEAEPCALSPAGRDFLRRALVRLAPSQRAAFVLREGLVLSWQTIGFVLGRREGPAARLLHYRAVLRLSELAATRPEVRACLAIRA